MQDRPKGPKPLRGKVLPPEKLSERRAVCMSNTAELKLTILENHLEEIETKLERLTQEKQRVSEKIERLKSHLSKSESSFSSENSGSAISRLNSANN